MEFKEIKEIKKIYKYLDTNKYHIGFGFDGEKETWKLFEKYDGWMTDGSKAIMTSETHTNKELIKFLKKNKKYEAIDMMRLLIIIPIMGLSLAVLNTFIRSEKLIALCTGINLCSWIIILINLIVTYKNSKVYDRELKARERIFFASLNRFKEK